MANPFLLSISNYGVELLMNMWLFINNDKEMAFLSGSTGQRAVQTWTSKIKILDKLGFIKTAPGPQGQYSYALIMNPYKVIERLYKKKKSGIPDSYYHALLARAAEIGAEDI